jgi:epoxyqueuosine reductase
MARSSKTLTGSKRLTGVSLKESIIGFCLERGADLVGFAPVARWDEADEVPADFRPRAIWPPARTVIVIGIQMALPVVETTPSVLHMELYRTVNRQLDDLAVALMNHLNRRGHASFFFARDTYSSLAALEDGRRAAFSHVMAAKYAGLGTIGLSHCLLTPEFGPRVRFVSVFTTAGLPGDAIVSEELCIRCGMCAQTCPARALKKKEGSVVGEYDKGACLEMARELTRKGCYPCGSCTKVCPTGEDRKLYPQPGIGRKYKKEAAALARNPDDPEYRAWQHIRRYGARPE